MNRGRPRLFKVACQVWLRLEGRELRKPWSCFQKALSGVPVVFWPAVPFLGDRSLGDPRWTRRGRCSRARDLALLAISMIPSRRSTDNFELSLKFHVLFGPGTQRHVSCSWLSDRQIATEMAVRRWLAQACQNAETSKYPARRSSLLGSVRLPLSNRIKPRWTSSITGCAVFMATGASCRMLQGSWRPCRLLGLDSQGRSSSAPVTQEPLRLI